MDTLRSSVLASWGLFILAAFVASMLAALATTGSWAARLAAEVEPRLSGDFTVVVWGRGLESADAATARAVESLSTGLGVTASALEPDVSDPWVAALIGGGKPAAAGSRLIAVRTRVGGASAPGLVRRLDADGVTAVADDHRGATGPLERHAILGGLIVVGSVLFLCGVVLLASLWCGRAIVDHNERRMTLMIRLGARRRFLTSLVQRRVAETVVGGALIGVVLGALATASTIQADFSGLPAASRWTIADGAIILGCALVVVLIAPAGAAIGAEAALGRVERDR